MAISTDLAERLGDDEAVIAVVGASDQLHKYGSIIYRDLKRRGCRVRAVNPQAETVDGDPAYPNLAALPERPVIVNMVVPPAVGISVAREAVELGWDGIWLQPGAESPEILAFLAEQGIAHLANVCIMVMARVVAANRRLS